MGFARLHFSGKNIASVLHDVAGVLSGTYTSVNQLLSATQASSYINNTANSNWSLVFPSSLPATVSTSNASWVLSAPCVDSAKTKFMRLVGIRGGDTGVAPSNVLNGTGTNPYGQIDAGGTSDTTTSALLMLGCTAAASATSTSNQTPWFNGTLAAGIGDRYITLHWSQRHCLIYGDWDPDADTKIAFFLGEHNETNISLMQNTAPFSYVYYVYSTNSWVTSAATAGGQYGGSVLNHMIEFNHYNNTTQVYTGCYNPLSHAATSTLDDDFTLTNRTVSANYPTVATKNSAGVQALYLQPLFYHQFDLGIPHMYYSYLSDIYRVSGSAGTEGDLITVGSDTYVYLPLTTGLAFAVKRA